MGNDSQAPVLGALTTAHLPQALALSTEMGWPYRLEDWAFAHRLGAGLALEAAGRLIGTAMRWDYGTGHSSVGMIIVARAFQGHGYGARLVDALLDDAGSRSVFLNATQEAVELYKRRGFVRTGELQQHQGVPVPADPREHIRVADAADLPRILQMDLEGLGMPRVELLRSLMDAGRMLVCEDGDAARGYAAYREFGRGFVIGPVVATSVELARSLIEHAISRLPGRFVRVDTSADSGLAPWLEARGLPRVDTATVMVRGTLPPASGSARVYALCSQSLG